jgi:hypothetical protein
MRDKAELAKQLRTYADAITAFAVLQSVAFGIALGGKDFRESVLKLHRCQIDLMCAGALVLYIVFVAACHYGEDAVLDVPKGQTGKAETWTHYIRVGRFIVIAVAQGLNFLAIYFTFHGAEVAAVAHTGGL